MPTNTDTVAIGTFDDLMGHPDPGEPDPNPHIPCGECGESYRWEWWKPKVDEMDAPHEETWLCDECERLERRKEENHTLGWFV